MGLRGPGIRAEPFRRPYPGMLGLNGFVANVTIKTALKPNCFSDNRVAKILVRR